MFGFEKISDMYEVMWSYPAGLPSPLSQTGSSYFETFRQYFENSQKGLQIHFKVNCEPNLLQLPLELYFEENFWFWTLIWFTHLPFNISATKVGPSPFAVFFQNTCQSFQGPTPHDLLYNKVQSEFKQFKQSTDKYMLYAICYMAYGIWHMIYTCKRVYTKFLQSDRYVI